jgi:hypothetical protein
MNSEFDGLTRMACVQLWQLTVVTVGIGVLVRLFCCN